MTRADNFRRSWEAEADADPIATLRAATIRRAARRGLAPYVIGACFFVAGIALFILAVT